MEKEKTGVGHVEELKLQIPESRRNVTSQGEMFGKQARTIIFDDLEGDMKKLDGKTYETESVTYPTQQELPAGVKEIPIREDSEAVFDPTYGEGGPPYVVRLDDPWTEKLKEATTLGERQQIFSQMAARLILKAHFWDYEVRIGHALRCQQCPRGSINSLHKKKLALDLNLFDSDGTYLTETEDHRELGEWWESIGGSWGGRFGDGNHYSVEYRG